MHLIQHPAKYHMQKVRVIGFAGVEFEGTALYVSRDDHENGISKNGVWLDMDIDNTTKRFDQKYVLVEGTFDKNRMGHLGMNSGGLKGIDRIELWGKDRK